MVRITTRLSLACLLVCSGLAAAENITVHVSGYADKPGRYSIPRETTLEALSKTFGGATWGAPKRITVIRLKRPPNATTEDPGQPETKVLTLEQVTNGKKQLVLEAEDIVFVPMKRVVGR